MKFDPEELILFWINTVFLLLEKYAINWSLKFSQQLW